MDPIQESISPSEEFYMAELLRSGCDTETNTNLVYDPRFTPSGLYTNVYTVQSDNSVLDLLQASADFSEQVDVDTKKSDTISSWNRSTIGWSLTCESEGHSRQFAYDTVGGSLGSSDKIAQLKKTGVTFSILFAIAVAASIGICVYFRKDTDAIIIG